MKISFFLQKEEDFLKNKPTKITKKTQFLKLKTGPLMLRNMLGPIFNFNLDQFLTLEFSFFLFVLVVFWLKPLFYSAFSKKCKIERNTKKKKDTICEHTCANCSCQNVRFFFLHFSFLLFLEFPCFSEIFLTGFQKSKNNKI